MISKSAYNILPWRKQCIRKTGSGDLQYDHMLYKEYTKYLNTHRPSFFYHLFNITSPTPCKINCRYSRNEPGLEMARGLCYNKCVPKKQGAILSTIPGCQDFAIQ